MQIRCGRCRATPVTLSLVDVLRTEVPSLRGIEVYELSSRGALVRFLRAQGAKLKLSEYLDGVPPGQWKNGIRCEDVMALTFGSQIFDLVTSTEVFEHIPDDLQGFQEIVRVLRPGGKFIFTVPMTGQQETVERARKVNGEVVHLKEPEYHSDRLRGSGQVLCYRNYGDDIVDRMRIAGFRTARIATPANSWFSVSRRVIVGTV